MQKTREYQTLLYACTQEGCSICRLAQESADRYLDAWKYELFTDVEVRQMLRRSRGFCHPHTWQLAHMGATLQLAQAYRDIITDTTEQLQNSTEATAPSAGLLRRFFDSSSPGSKREQCPACYQKEQAEIRSINTLRKVLLDEDFYRQFAASDGLCLEHFRLASELKMSDTPGDWLPLLRQAQQACLQRLDEQLREMIRKHDYHFRDEARGSEMLSWKRAAAIIAGEENSP
jgi:hypothetical protein